MPTPILTLDPDQLENVFSPSYLDRGRRYWRDGRVLAASMNAAKQMVTGRVRGSAGQIYQCIIHFTQPEDGAADLIGHCSCPVGYNCKHVAAVLLSLNAPTTQQTSPAADADLPLEVRLWLGQAERLAASVAQEGPYRVVYLLGTARDMGPPRVLVRARKARLLATGGYGKPQDFNIAGRSRAAFLTPEDQRVMALVQAGSQAETISEARLDTITGADILREIVQSGRGYWHSLEGPPLHYAGPLAGRLVWRLDDDALLRVVLEAERAGLHLLPVAPPWYLDPVSGDCGPLETGMGDRQAALLVGAPALSPELAEALTQAARTQLQRLELPMPPHTERRRVGVEKPVPCLCLNSHDRAETIRNRYWGAAPEPDWTHVAELFFDYGGHRLDPRDTSAVVRRAEQGVLLEGERDSASEATAIATLGQIGFTRTTPYPDQVGMGFELPDNDAWLSFMGRDRARLEAAGWRVETMPDFRLQVAKVGDWRMDVDETDDGRWLDLGLGVEVDGELIDLLPLLIDMLRRAQGDLSPWSLAQQDDAALLPVQLGEGRLMLMPAARLRPILTTLVELYDSEPPVDKNGRLRLPRPRAAQLADLEDADPALGWRGGISARDWGRRLRNFSGMRETPPPAELQAELRPYQRQGLDWLQFLRELALGGILADDMGLGKTIQTLAHLLVEKASGRADRPSLVVAPTSLMFNWRREAERFAPSLRVLLLHGADRHTRFAAIGEHDLVLTTYPLLPRDLEALSAQSYHLLILDEAQAIKNPRGKAAEAARGLAARHRLCLTGTPLENHLGELWALLDFLIPGMLSDERRFRRLFRTPIERHGDPVRQEQLRRRVAPFLLRRTKEAVATELPPKTEILREVPLASDQRDLYETLRLALHETVRAEVERRGIARSGIIILDALLKLRQVCCDPRLVALEGARKVKGSAKLDLLLTLLPELLEEGRRVLLFSQFTSMLALIEEGLMQGGRRENQDFVKLTGRTRNRALPVDRFQAGEVPLFLISLKAGGSGLNLTAADTVIHYDPWWNPAAERQATDRAHRIGQDKPVFVYKLLTEGTVEQRVAELQARKQALADAMLAEGGAAARSLSAEDLDLLFAPIND